MQESFEIEILWKYKNPISFSGNFFNSDLKIIWFLEQSEN